MVFVVLSGADRVAPFIKTVQTQADTEKKALGFLPISAYQQAANSRRLLVAINRLATGDDYAGHVFFGGTYPHIRIFQVYVLPRFRRKHVASLLVQTVIKEAEEYGYLSVLARVAADLDSANAFWEHEGLLRRRQVRGGGRRSRTINIRVRDLETPTLFSSHGTAALDVARFSIEPPLPSTPAYAIDVNVFLDLIKSRAYAAAARQIVTACWTRAVDVFVAEEFVEELQRAATTPSDPVFQLATALPRLPSVPQGVSEQIMNQLAPIVFPAKVIRGTLSRRDQSDLRHLAAAVHHKLNGFITGEKAILRRAPELLSQVGLDVIGTLEFAAYVESPDQRAGAELRSGISGDDVEIRELAEEDRKAVEALLESLGLARSLAAAALIPSIPPNVRRRISVRSLGSGEILGYASWDVPSPLRKRVDAHVFVKEQSEGAQHIAVHLLKELSRDLAMNGPCLVSLRTEEGHSNARTAALEVGFRSFRSLSAVPSDLTKIVLWGVITKDNWNSSGTRLNEVSGVRWSGTMPKFGGPKTLIDFKSKSGHEFRLALVEAERLFGPTLFLLPERAGILVPIRRRYAEHLFMGAPQMALFPRKGAALSAERVYFRSPSHASVFSVGSPVVFYESLSRGGRGSAFAAGVVVSNRLVWAETLPKRVFSKGVLDQNTVNKMSRNGLVSVLHFDNILDLPNPVPLSRLRALGAIDGANLVAPRRLESRTLCALLAEANALAL
ncbi:MAG: GNAT family N-acetyltransferase [Acidobacteria bacterium]|nr:GNAT family N-acetyltransferase [Acidobacteriota bacterium]